ncbi:hypothetical protein WMF31_04005 [Sorangium sp. So ce1036]|uniref:hypothetical protein n=1 Tax=Sorangium sp. So ce1036 TaxID=3133328 RepID=UPI003F12282C
MDAKSGLGDLLQPSLERDVAPRAMLSDRAGFLVAFLGGPLAALLVGAFNTRALRRLGQDAWLLALALAWSILVVAVAAHATATTPSELAATRHVALFGHAVSAAVLRRLVQASGLLVFLAFFLRHRRFHRAAALADAKPARPWIVGLSCLLAGGGLQFVLTMAMLAAFR